MKRVTHTNLLANSINYRECYIPTVNGAGVAHCAAQPSVSTNYNVVSTLKDDEVK